MNIPENNSLSYQKFHNYRNKRYIKPKYTAFSLEAHRKDLNLEEFPIKDLKKKHVYQINAKEKFDIGHYHLINPKKLSSRVHKPETANDYSRMDSNNLISKKIVFRNDRKFKIEDSRLSNENFSKLSTKDNSIQNISRNYKGGIYQNQTSKRSNSENIMKNKESENKFIEKAEKNEILLGKIRNVFTIFKGKQEEILRKFNDGRRNKMKEICLQHPRFVPI